MRMILRPSRSMNSLGHAEYDGAIVIGKTHDSFEVRDLCEVGLRGKASWQLGASRSAPGASTTPAKYHSLRQRMVFTGN